MSLTVLATEDWYTHVSLLGRVTELLDDPSLSDMDRLARHHTGAPYHMRDRDRVSAWIDVDRWHCWDAAENRDVPHH